MPVGAAATPGRQAARHGRPARRRDAKARKSRPAVPAPLRIQFDLTTVRLLIATAEPGSITRAAERICLTPAAASRRMKELEAQFGVVLFQRRPHGMALTDAGMALLAHAR